jgi:hypothetical protein
MCQVKGSTEKRSKITLEEELRRTGKGAVSLGELSLARIGQANRAKAHLFTIQPPNFKQIVVINHKRYKSNI